MRTTKGDGPAHEVPKGDILVYLEGPRPTLKSDLEDKSADPENGVKAHVRPPRNRRRVIDREDLQQLLNFGGDPE